MKCIECFKRIHPERLAAIPQAKTCSAECSAARKRRLRSESRYPLPPETASERKGALVLALHLKPFGAHRIGQRRTLRVASPVAVPMADEHEHSMNDRRGDGVGIIAVA